MGAEKPEYNNFPSSSEGSHKTANARILARTLTAIKQLTKTGQMIVDRKVTVTHHLQMVAE